MKIDDTVEPLLSGQPPLSGHFLKSRGWPLNRGPTVVDSHDSFCQLSSPQTKQDKTVKNAH